MYVEAYIEIVHHQLATARVRFAKVLNDSFP
jgi:hypothetical protein